MPSKSPAKAALEVKKEREARWLYLIRNTKFREDIRALRRLSLNDENNFGPMRKGFLQKWGLTDMPVDMMQFYGSFARKAPLRYPVDAFDASVSPHDSDERVKPKQFAKFTVDLSYPLYLLVPLIEEELRKLHPHPKFRRHRKKDLFKLQVYDHIVLKDLTFPETAKLLKAKVSTVKSAYLVACRKIFPQNRPPSKMETLQAYAGESGVHDCSKCPTCKVAVTPRDLCSIAKRYAGQDYVSEHEKLADNSDE